MVALIRIAILLAMHIEGNGAEGVCIVLIIGKISRKGMKVVTDLTLNQLTRRI